MPVRAPAAATRISHLKGSQPGIDTPILDGKISATSETAIVSHATPSLEIVELYGGRLDCFSSPLNRQKLKVLALLATNPFTGYGFVECGKAPVHTIRCGCV